MITGSACNCPPIPGQGGSQRHNAGCMVGSPNHSIPDPRLVAALAGALCDCRPTPTESGPCRYRQREALHGLPAFLADPRTQEWLAELNAAWLRLFDTVHLMRAHVGHDHVPPWPCPVVLVDDAMTEIRRTIGERDLPPDLADIQRARFAAAVLGTTP